MVAVAAVGQLVVEEAEQQEPAQQEVLQEPAEREGVSWPPEAVVVGLQTLGLEVVGLEIDFQLMELTA